jgi:hypothetical protein
MVMAMADFWKIECLHCGVNADLLTDSWHRIICRSCLVKYEFKEVENEIQSRGRYSQGSGNSYDPERDPSEDLGHGESFKNEECESKCENKDDKENTRIELFTEGF